MSSWQPPQVLIWLTGDSGDSGSPPLKTVCRLPWQPVQSLMARSPLARRPWMLPAMALNSSSWQSWHTCGLTGPSGLRGCLISSAASWQSAQSSLRCAERPKCTADTASDLPSSDFISGSSWQLRHFSGDTCCLSAAAAWLPPPGLCRTPGPPATPAARLLWLRRNGQTALSDPAVEDESKPLMTLTPCRRTGPSWKRQTVHASRAMMAFSTGEPVCRLM